MPRRISSLITPFSKFAVQAILIFWIGYSLFWDRPWNINDVAGLACFTVPFFVILVVTFWLYVPIKRVKVDNDNLYVSNYFKEITIPVSEIENVREMYLTEPRRVTILLRNPTEFGQKIVFLATHRFAPLAFLDPHPIVDELIAMSVRKTLG